MEASIAALIILTVVLFGVLTLAHGYISAQDMILESWRGMEERLGDRARTNISLGATSATSITVTAILTNTGSVKLADFDQWDVIVQYDTNNDGRYNVVEWRSYSESEWTRGVVGTFEPNIFNPGELMTIMISVSSPPISTTGRAIIATPNGINTSKDFTR